MIRQSEFAEKFIVRFVAQFLECREVRRTVSCDTGLLGECVLLRDGLVEIPGSVAWSSVRDIIDYMHILAKAVGMCTDA